MFRSATKSDLLRENLFKPFLISLKDSRDILRDVSGKNKNRGYSDKVEATILMVLPEVVGW